MDPMTQMRLDFNRHLLDAIGGQILDTSVFAWSSGFTAWLLGLCMAIAFFQSVLKSEKSMLVEWTKIIIASWFCLAILGGVNATKVPVFSQMNSSLPEKYKVKTKNSPSPTLERIVFNWMAWKFDQLGEAIIVDKSGKKGDLNKEIYNLNSFQSKLIYAIAECNANDPNCLHKYLTAADPAAVKEAESKTDPSNKGSNDVSIMGVAIPGTGVIVSFLGAVAAFFAKINNPAFWLFPILIWILDIVRAFVNYFVLLTFGIISAMSLFMTKILCVLMVIPSYRDRVIGMFKFTLSASMYGFAMNLMLWISIVITKALNEATATIIITRLSNGIGASFPAEIGTLMISNFLTSFVIILMQIVAMTKVPTFTEKLMNLSLQEIVNIGETLFKAGLGMAKVAAGMAAGVGGLALGAAGGMAMGALSKTAAGSAVSNLGTSVSGGFRRMLGGGGGGPGDFGGSPGGGSPAGGDSGGGMFTPNPAMAGRGGSDLNAAAIGEANLKATTSRKPDTLLKGEKDESEMTAEEKLAHHQKIQENKDKADQDEANSRVATLKSGGKVGAGVDDNALTAGQKRAKRDAQITKGLGMAKSFAGFAGKTLAGMALDGAMGGAGMGDGLSTFKTTANALSENPGKTMAATMAGTSALVDKGINKFDSWAGTSLKQVDHEDRAEQAEELFKTAVVGGKTDMNEADSSMLDQNLAAINSGTASNAQMKEVLAMQNKKNLSAEQKGKISKARATSDYFGQMMSDQEASNAKLMAQATKEFQSGRGIRNETMEKLNTGAQEGLMDLGELSNMNLGGGKTLGKELNNITHKDLNTKLDPMMEKLNSGQGLSVAEQQAAGRMYDSQQRSLVGQSALLDKFDKVLGGSRNVDGLRMSREDATVVAEEVMQNMNKAVAQDQMAAEIVQGFEMSMGSQTQNGVTTYSGNVDGFYLGGQAVTNSADLAKVSPENQQLFDDLYKSLDRAMNDPETQKIVKERMAGLQVNSENMQQLHALMKKIKGNKG